MNHRRTKKLRAELIEILGRAPSASEWRRYKKHGIGIPDSEVPQISPARSAEIKEAFMDAVASAYQPKKAKRSWWQRLIDWIFRR